MNFAEYPYVARELEEFFSGSRWGGGQEMAYLTYERLVARDTQIEDAYDDLALEFKLREQDEDYQTTKNEIGKLGFDVGECFFFFLIIIIH